MPIPIKEIKEAEERTGSGMEGILHGVVNMGRMNQGLAGHASKVETIASQFLFLFDEQGLCAQLGGAGGDRQSGGSSTDDAYIIVVGVHG